MFLVAMTVGLLVAVRDPASLAAQYVILSWRRRPKATIGIFRAPAFVSFKFAGFHGARSWHHQ